MADVCEGKNGEKKLIANHLFSSKSLFILFMKMFRPSSLFAFFLEIAKKNYFHRKLVTIYHVAIQFSFVHSLHF